MKIISYFFEALDSIVYIKHTNKPQYFMECKLDVVDI